MGGSSGRKYPRKARKNRTVRTARPLSPSRRASVYCLCTSEMVSPSPDSSDRPLTPL